MIFYALRDVGYEIRAELIWAKSRPGFNFANYKHQHEPIYYACHQGVNFCGDKSQTTLWEVASESGAVYKHPTQKPVDLIIRALVNHSASHILDIFGGSGSTLIACEKLDRRCFMMEIDEYYCDVSIQRWQNFTGKQAIKL